MKHFYNILLIDDNETTIYYNKIIIKHLNSLNSTYEVHNGIEALEFLKKEDTLIDVILLDLNMPVMDGFEFLNEYKKLYKYSKIKIIALTTSNWNIDKEKVELNKHLISAYVEKPLKKETLVKLLNEDNNMVLA